MSKIIREFERFYTNIRSTRKIKQDPAESTGPVIACSPPEEGSDADTPSNLAVYDSGESRAVSRAASLSSADLRARAMHLGVFAGTRAEPRTLADFPLDTFEVSSGEPPIDGEFSHEWIDLEQRATDADVSDLESWAVVSEEMESLSGDVEAVEAADTSMQVDDEPSEEMEFDLQMQFEAQFGMDFPLSEEWLQQFKSSDMGIVLDNYGDFRRFRYYDLVRSKLRNNEDVDLQPFVQTCVRFSFNLDNEDLPMVPDSEEPSSILMSKYAPPSYSLVPTFIDFIQTDSADRMRQCVPEYERRVIGGEGLNEADVDILMARALEYTRDFVENVLRAFEGISAIVKKFIALVNRLQALANRRGVLSDGFFRDTLPRNVSLSRLLNTLVEDCAQLQVAILEFQDSFDRCQAYMQAHLDGLIARTNECLAYSDQCHDIFQVGLQHYGAETSLSESRVVWNEQYMRYIRFLRDVKNKQVFRFLVGDFDRMHASSRNILDVSSGLLKDSQNDYNSVSVFQ